MSARALKSPARVAAERRAERGRIAVLKAYGTAPTTTGHDVHPVAPARGRVTDWMPRGVVPGPGLGVTVLSRTRDPT